MDSHELQRGGMAMVHLGKSISILAAASAALLAAGCVSDAADGGSQASVAQASNGGTEIHPEDNCDPVTFTAARCNPAFPGTTTRQNFLDQVGATGKAVGWEYGGGAPTVS